MNRILHIASLLVQHRAEAVVALDACLAGLAGCELALREGGRSIVLCEAEDESALLDGMAALGRLDGVIGVSLVHHHAEDAASLSEEMQHDHTT